MYWINEVNPFVFVVHWRRVGWRWAFICCCLHQHILISTLYNRAPLVSDDAKCKRAEVQEQIVFKIMKWNKTQYMLLCNSWMESVIHWLHQMAARFQALTAASVVYVRLIFSKKYRNGHKLQIESDMQHRIQWSNTHRNIKAINNTV